MQIALLEEIQSLIEKIELYNNDKIDLTSCEVEQLEVERITLLQGYYTQNYSDNIIPIS